MSIGQRIGELRRGYGYSQEYIAEKLNVSRQAVSKWEQGESLPDVTNLKQIADLFSVTVDYLLTEEHTAATVPLSKRKRRNRAMITGISCVTVWLIACVLYFSLGFTALPSSGPWLSFVAAVPVTCIVLLIFSALWWGKKWLLTTVSVLIWSSLAFVFLLVFYIAGISIWGIFLIGIPAQVIVFLWAGLKKE